MSEWKEMSLGSICLIKGGKRLPKGHELIQEKTNHPYLRARDIGNGVINFDSPTYLKEETFKYIRNYIVKEGDVVITIVGANIGDVAYITEEFNLANLTENAVKLVAKRDLLEPKFLKYSLLPNSMKEYFQVIASGAAQGKLGLYKIKDVIINLPPLPIQKRIASILSAYDDLIENNLKRIKLLEEIAQRTYEEWFVKFRINGKQLPIDKKTGLPEGWEKIQVKDYVSEISKGPSLNYDFDGTKYPVINQSCIRNGEIELEKVLFAQELNANKENCYLKINDILINSMGQGTLGRVSKNVSINEKFIIHNCITFLRAKETLSQYQLFYFISSQQSYFEGVAQGSTGQTTLKVSLIEELEISLPDKNIIKEFNKIVDPIWKQMGLLKNQNQHLKTSRDILLPKLMSGKIEVK